MAYRELRKLYYGDKEAYRREYQRRFSSEYAVHLDFQIGERQAFFLQTAEVWHLACSIARKDKEIYRLSAALPEAAKLQYSRRCMIDEIVLTNRIEGVRSSRKEIQEALDILDRQSAPHGRHRRFESLVNKYDKLMTREPIPLTRSQDIRDIYDELLLAEVIAEDPQNAPDGLIFRKDLTELHNAADKVIHRGLLPESRIIEAMEQALAFLWDERVEKLFRICLFHYLLEYIHPFYDGNGRLGRFLLSYCISETLEPLLAYRISETIRENISAYNRAFQSCNDPHTLGDLTPFLLMQLQMIDLSSQELCRELQQRLIRLERYTQLIPTFPGTKESSRLQQLYRLLIQAALFSENGVSTGELEQQMQASYYAIKQLLGLMPEHLLQTDKRGREKFYQCNLNALDELSLT